MSVKNVRFVWDDALHGQVRRSAFNSGVTMAAFVERAVREAVRHGQVGVGSRSVDQPNGEDQGQAPRAAKAVRPVAEQGPVRDFSKTTQVKKR